MALLITFSAVAVDSCEEVHASNDADVGGLELVWRQTEGETLEFCLVARDELPVCGAHAVISFPSDFIKLKGIKISDSLAERGGVLSFVDRGNELELLLDIGENYRGKELGKIVFEAVQPFEGRTLELEMQVLSLYFWQDGELISIEQPKKGVISVTLGDFESESGFFLLETETWERGGETELLVSVAVPKSCFAAGFEMCVLDFSGFESQHFSVIGVLGAETYENRRFSYTMSFPADEKYCVIIRPIAYLGKRVASGEESVILIGASSGD